MRLKAIHRAQVRRRSTLPTLKTLHPPSVSCGTPRCQHVAPSSNAMSCGERAGEREKRERGIPRGPKEQSLLTPRATDGRDDDGRVSVVIPTPVRSAVPPSVSFCPSSQQTTPLRMIRGDATGTFTAGLPLSAPSRPRQLFPNLLFAIRYHFIAF